MFGRKKKDEKVALGNLIDGVNLPQNTSVQVKMNTNEVMISGNNQEFLISFEKLVNVDLKSDVEMEQIIEQSLPGMVIGAAAFGVIGAMIGGRVKTKEKKKVSHFLIINFQSDELKTIVIDASKDWYNAAGLVDLFRKFNNVQTAPVRQVL
ncbi:hypothetical protein ACFO0S_09830 [Chryseomicrobium palamuruense]|uniref:Uncharacterized protein n=1 Tax=Chryseomicrobium palamuruense TaxID=682973 RepID=A0ABV8UXA0_9BACL